MMKVAERARSEQRISDSSNSGISKRQGQALTGERTVAQVDQPENHNRGGIFGPSTPDDGAILERAVKSCQPWALCTFALWLPFGLAVAAGSFYALSNIAPDANGDVGEVFSVMAKNPAFAVTSYVCFLVAMAAFVPCLFCCQLSVYMQRRAEQAEMERRTL
ncbi:hypothetical protein [Parendozoicomonas haliclonae]|uniref:Transmembrane protein n=1 Tax=Parendozoicomonas haliclonae TaxID=1960125 RepID=A0A1X7AN43_9GAMM|nr:hypothetical protein [Parendozoicomonas haliclonae]SMA49731.1 hypothetical protein EHSB41UT_03513 [Parendozoicomonas haliclonae]